MSNSNNERPNPSGFGGVGGWYAPGDPRNIKIREEREAQLAQIPATASIELIEKRKATCRACESFRDPTTKIPFQVPFCTQKCGSNLQYKWGNEASKCCIGKW